MGTSRSMQIQMRKHGKLRQPRSLGCYAAASILGRDSGDICAASLPEKEFSSAQQRWMLGLEGTASSMSSSALGHEFKPQAPRTKIFTRALAWPCGYAWSRRLAPGRAARWVASCSSQLLEAVVAWRGKAEGSLECSWQCSCDRLNQRIEGCLECETCDEAAKTWTTLSY